LLLTKKIQLHSDERKRKRPGGQIYDVALTPRQRLIKIVSVSPAIIEKLEAECPKLDPVVVLSP
jgi:hypothetical protein